MLKFYAEDAQCPKARSVNIFLTIYFNSLEKLINCYFSILTSGCARAVCCYFHPTTAAAASVSSSGLILLRRGVKALQ